jgi:hypothetical protein
MKAPAATDETALIVTLISGDTVRGLRDADGSFFSPLRRRDR